LGITPPDARDRLFRAGAKKLIREKNNLNKHWPERPRYHRDGQRPFTKINLQIQILLGLKGTDILKLKELLPQLFTFAASSKKASKNRT
jgi:hypothetical protein